MTTIAVSRSLMMMAADGNMTVEGRKHLSDPKMVRMSDRIVGAAGDGDDIFRFLKWLKKPDAKRPRGNYMVLELHRDGKIVWYTDSETVIEEDHFAIGTGGTLAIASMDTMLHLGLAVDPRIAVRVACVRDTMSTEPVHSLRWKNVPSAEGK